MTTPDLPSPLYGNAWSMLAWFYSHPSRDHALIRMPWLTEWLYWMDRRSVNRLMQLPSGPYEYCERCFGTMMPEHIKGPELVCDTCARELLVEEVCGSAS